LKGQTICESERLPERGRFHSSRQQILKFLRIKADGTLDRSQGGFGASESIPMKQIGLLRG